MNSMLLFSIQITILNAVIAPIGRGLRTIPTIVQQNITSKCHAWSDNPSGVGNVHINIPKEKMLSI